MLPTPEPSASGLQPGVAPISAAQRPSHGESYIMALMKIGRLAWLAILLRAGVVQAASVTTLVGTGQPGFSDTQVNNPYGMAIGPDGAMYFCDLDNSRIRRLDLRTKRMTTIAGNGQKGYRGDGGAATEASLSAPHELLFDSRGDLY